MVNVKQANPTKILGKFHTPNWIAELICNWAIESPNDLVLDPGAGTGIFCIQALKRLQKLGSNSPQHQVFAIELDSEDYHKLTLNLLELFPDFPVKNLIQADFLDLDPNSLPKMDAIVGNPPYVERQRFYDSRKLANLLSKLAKLSKEFKPHSAMDIYGYFLIHALDFLKPHGKLGFVISDTWLNMDFGKFIKIQLLKFRIDAIIGFDSRVFPEALVRTVVILIQKSEPKFNHKLIFARLKSNISPDQLQELLNSDESSTPDFCSKYFRINQSELEPAKPWGVYLKASPLYFKLVSHPKMIPLHKIAQVNIGLQTLRKDFFIVDSNKLEQEYTQPIALSPRDTPLVINSPDQLRYRVICCDLPKHKLVGTRLYQYILEAESKLVSPRDKHQLVKGVQNIPRMVKSRRKPWYNLIPEIQKNRKAPILLPRRFYQRFFVVWNRLRVIANENFICITPKNPDYLIPLLCVLNSEVIEYLIRVNSQLYGGGVVDLRPNDVKNLPVIDLTKLNPDKLTELASAYETYLNGDRNKINKLIEDLLELNQFERAQLSQELQQLRELSILTRTTMRQS
ncbi:MAG: hypothetical protein DRO98_08305 [Archaeoglobales archaeon]|nr:MAG: hypothetical protein DRO98_08305 [Archaeoglobales archaeon]